MELVGIGGVRFGVNEQEYSTDYGLGCNLLIAS